MKSTFEFDNYKEALKNTITSQSGGSRGVYRILAEKIGVHPTLISQILSGTRDFNEEQLFAICESLGIPDAEKRYLLVLLQIERAGSHSLKKHYIEIKNQIRKESLQLSRRISPHKTLTESEKAVFYSSWLYSAVQILTAIDKPVDFKLICEHFKLTPQRTQEVLDFLLKHHLVLEKKGRYVPGTTSTHLPKGSPHIVKHHSNWRLKAMMAAETLTDQELMYSANFSIAQKDFEVFREELVQLIKRFLTIVEKSPAEKVAQFNMDLFWLNG